MIEVSESIITNLLRASAGLSIAALLVWASVRLLHLRAARVEQWAWLSVLLQGIILYPVPITITIPFFVAASSAHHGLADSAARAADPDPRASERDGTAGRRSGSPSDLSRGDDRQRGARVAPVGPQVAGREHRIPVSLVALGVWAGGMAGLTALALLRYRAFAVRLRATCDPTPEWLDQWKRILDEFQISKPVPLRVSPDAGPALCLLPSGYRLVVPEALWAELAPAQRAAILRHELAHFQRGDLWTALLARGLAVIHWFNLLAWWALSRFEEQSEFVCDQIASRDEPAAFAEVLLRLGSARKPWIAVARSAHAGSLFTRIQRLLRDADHAPRWKCTTLVAVAVAALLASALRFQPAAESATQVADSGARQTQAGAGTSLPARAVVQIGTDDLRTRERLQDIEFTPDGKLIAAAAASNADFPRIALFDIKTGREVKRLTPPDRKGGGYGCIAISHDGSRLIAGDNGGNVTIWDLINARMLARVKLHGGGGVVNGVVVDESSYIPIVNAVAFSPDGTIMASAGADGAIHLRKIERPTEVLRDFRTERIPNGGPRMAGMAGGMGRGGPPANTGFEQVRSLAFTPDGTILIAGTGIRASILGWRVKDGQLVRRITRAHGNREGSRGGSVDLLGVTPDGRFLISAGGCSVPVNLTSLTRLAERFARVALSEVRVWELETGRLVKDLTGGDHQGLGHATLSRDGARVALADLGELRVIDTDRGQTVQTIMVPRSGGVRPAISPDGTLIADAADNTVNLFDAGTGKPLFRDDRTPVGEPLCAAWSPSGDRIVTGHHDGMVRIWNSATGELQWSKALAADGDDVMPPNFVTFSRDGRRIIIAGGEHFQPGGVAIYEATRGLLVRRFDFKQITHAALSPDREMLVIAVAGNANIVAQLVGLELETGRRLWPAQSDDKSGIMLQLRAIQFRPDSASFDVAMCNGVVAHFESRTGRELGRFRADWRPAPVQKADPPMRLPQVLWLGTFSADNRTLVTSCADHVYVWDVETGKMRTKIHRAHKWGTYLALAPDGKTLATCDERSADDYGSDTIRLYDIETGHELLTLDPPDNRAVVMTFSPDGKKLFTAFQRGSGMVWDVRPTR
jgi:WD40 repeat protein/beta-lactamase regulating signal transducer with metallopeptidase domain